MAQRDGLRSRFIPRYRALLAAAPSLHAVVRSVALRCRHAPAAAHRHNTLGTPVGRVIARRRFIPAASCLLPDDGFHGEGYDSLPGRGASGVGVRAVGG